MSPELDITLRLGAAAFIGALIGLNRDLHGKPTGVKTLGLVGESGSGKTTLARHLASILPAVDAVADCPFHCNPIDPVCPACKDKKEKGDALETVSIQGNQRFVRIQGSPDLTAEDLLGSYPAVQYVPPEGDYWIDLLARLGEAFRRLRYMSHD